MKISYTEILLLKTLQTKKELFGTQIQEQIEQAFGAKFSYSTLYPKLALLEAKGLVASRGETKSRRKYYKITEEGKAKLNEWENAFASLGNKCSDLKL